MSKKYRIIISVALAVAVLAVAVIIINPFKTTPVNELKEDESFKPKKVAALSGSLAEIWTLAGGEITATTQDTFDERKINLSGSVVNVGSLKEPNAELLISNQIDYAILTPTISGQVALGKTLEQAGIKVDFFEIETFSDYLLALKTFTDITKNTEAYETYGLSLQSKIDKIIEGCAPKADPTVLLIRAFSTGAKAKNSQNNMTGAMLADLGCVNIADSDNGLLEDLSIEKIIIQDPDFIFVTTMGADDAALATLAEGLQKNPAWNSLKAVKNGHYIVLPKELFHYKPNKDWDKSYKMLAEILYGYEE